MNTVETIQLENAGTITRSYGLYLVADNIREIATDALSDDYTEVCVEVGGCTYEMTFDEFIKRVTCDLSSVGNGDLS